jgi:glycolate oxidase
LNDKNRDSEEKMNMYRPVDEPVVRRLTDIAGPKAVFSDEDTLAIYSRDETIGLSHRPEIVVKPGTPEEILEIMRLANLENIPLTPRGKGTGLSGGAIPVYGGSFSLVKEWRKSLTSTTITSWSSPSPESSRANCKKRLR